MSKIHPDIKGKTSRCQTVELLWFSQQMEAECGSID